MLELLLFTKINTAIEQPDFLNLKVQPVTNATSQDDDFIWGGSL